MRSLAYPASFGYHTRTVKIVELGGSHGYQIYLDDYYQGMTNRVGGQLTAHMREPIEMNGDDVMAMFEIIEMEVAQNKGLYKEMNYLLCPSRLPLASNRSSNKTPFFIHFLLIDEYATY